MMVNVETPAQERNGLTAVRKEERLIWPEYSARSYIWRDRILALLGMILLSPVILMLMLALLCTQHRIFFVQQRPGYREKPFRLYKFATLTPPGGKNGGQPTRLGNWLRRSSLDELPQLLNVLKGDMVLVGPRPLLMEYLPLYSPEEHMRHAVPPGITGWAQVNGRNLLTFKEKFQHDLWYIRHRSHKLDLIILCKTLGSMWQGAGEPGGKEGLPLKYNGSN